MEEINIILPNQLFKTPSLKKENKTYLIEEYLFFRQYNFHKQKISFHRSSMKFYQDYLIKKGLDVCYVNSYDKESSIIELIKNVYNVSQKQLNTLGQKKVSLKKPNTVNEAFELFLNSKR